MWLVTTELSKHALQKSHLFTCCTCALLRCGDDASGFAQAGQGFGTRRGDLRRRPRGPPPGEGRTLPLAERRARLLRAGMGRGCRVRRLGSLAQEAQQSSHHLRANGPQAPGALCNNPEGPHMKGMLTNLPVEASCNRGAAHRQSCPSGRNLPSGPTLCRVPRERLLMLAPRVLLDSRSQKCSSAGCRKPEATAAGTTSISASRKVSASALKAAQCGQTSAELRTTFAYSRRRPLQCMTTNILSQQSVQRGAVPGEACNAHDNAKQVENCQTEAHRTPSDREVMALLMCAMSSGRKGRSPIGPTPGSTCAVMRVRSVAGRFAAGKQGHKPG